MAEIEPRNTTKTPPQTKKSTESSRPHFHLDTWPQSVVPTQNGTAETEKIQPRGPLKALSMRRWEHGQQAGVRQLLATTWQDMRLLLSHPPESPLGSLLGVEST